MRTFIKNRPKKDALSKYGTNVKSSYSSAQFFMLSLKMCLDNSNHGFSTCIWNPSWSIWIGEMFYPRRKDQFSILKSRARGLRMTFLANGQNNFFQADGHDKGTSSKEGEWILLMEKKNYFLNFLDDSLKDYSQCTLCNKLYNMTYWMNHHT